MRGALGNSLLLFIIIFCVSLIVLLFLGILSYSKAYKAKNRIIEIIEKYEDYNINAEEEVIFSLGTMGYQLGSCKDKEKNKNTSDYKYCIYEQSTENGGNYYKVVTYVQFYFPVINELVDNISVHGETKILGKSYNYE